MKKKVATKFGQGEVPKTHPLCPAKGDFAMSAYLQELACYVGKDLPFEQAEKYLDKLANIELGAKQIERICHHYGEILENQSIDNQQDNAMLAEAELCYAMVDGSMILTRENGWKEIKVGRIFKASDSLQLSEKRACLRRSDYTVHLGSHTDFFKKFDFKTDRLKKMVCIGDGAKWIWEHFGSSYPEAVQILDYFHCKEKLAAFVDVAFPTEEEQKRWIAEQERLLFDDGIKTVIQNIENQGCKNKDRAKKESLTTYFKNNKTRMLYGTYQKQGLLIGSGAIESAHRTLIQQRLKLSGQRWTLKGAQQVANIRACSYSENWGQLIQIIKLKGQ